MKKTITINLGQKRFAEEYTSACREFGVQHQNLRSKNICLFLKSSRAEVYHAGEKICLDNLRYAFFRVRGNYPLMTSLLGRLFVHKGIPLNDSSSVLLHTYGEEKITQMLVLTLANIPVPDSLLVTLNGFDVNKEFIFSQISFPCVLKVNGSQGRAVWKLSDENSLLKKIPEIDKSHEVVLLQKYVPNEYDIRALYFYGRYLGAIKRISGDGFYNNVSRGGRTEKTSLTAEEHDVAVRACRALGRDFGGVDLVRTPEGPLVFEVNVGPQVYGFEEATRTNVPRVIVERIKKDFLDTKQGLGS